MNQSSVLHCLNKFIVRKSPCMDVSSDPLFNGSKQTKMLIFFYPKKSRHLPFSFVILDENLHSIYIKSHIQSILISMSNSRYIIVICIERLIMDHNFLHVVFSSSGNPKVSLIRVISSFYFYASYSLYAMIITGSFGNGVRLFPLRSLSLYCS